MIPWRSTKEADYNSSNRQQFLYEGWSGVLREPMINMYIHVHGRGHAHRGCGQQTSGE